MKNAIYSLTSFRLQHIKPFESYLMQRIINSWSSYFPATYYSLYLLSEPTISLTTLLKSAIAQSRNTSSFLAADL